MARRADSKSRAAVKGRAVIKPRRPHTTKGGIVAFLAGTVLIVAALPLCLVFTAGMAPTIAAAIADRHPRRHLLRAVAVLNLAGMVLPVVTLVRIGLNIVGAATILLNPYNWLWMYGTAALGWLCYLGMPLLARVLVEAHAARTERELQRRAETLIEEWGEEVTGRKPAAAAAAPSAAA